MKNEKKNSSNNNVSFIVISPNQKVQNDKERIKSKFNFNISRTSTNSSVIKQSSLATQQNSCLFSDKLQKIKNKINQQNKQISNKNRPNSTQKAKKRINKIYLKNNIKVKNNSKEFNTPLNNDKNNFNQSKINEKIISSITYNNYDKYYIDNSSMDSETQKNLFSESIFKTQTIEEGENVSDSEENKNKCPKINICQNDFDINIKNENEEGTLRENDFLKSFNNTSFSGSSKTSEINRNNFCIMMSGDTFSNGDNIKINNNNNYIIRNYNYLNNNININNYINYTNNDLDNFIPKSTKNYDIISKSMKINNNNATLFKTPFNYFNNFNNLEELNIFNTNINFELNKNLNSDKNYQTIILEEKKGKKPEGILVNQINQICMVFNLIEQHYRNNKPSLFNCFIKWKKNVLKKTNYNNNINNCNLNEKKKINEKIINFKKIAIKNKNKNNHNLEINNIIKSQIKNNNYSLQPKDELKYNYEKINNNENIYSEKKTIKYNDFEFNNYNNILKNNNNKTIKYIELNRHTLDNYYESTLFKNNFNSEIVYQKKILNYNHIPNSNNFNNFPNNNIISDNKYSFKKINKIEEREVHFNSLSTNKNKSYNQINNNVIYNNIFQYNKKRNLEEMNNENFLEKELKNKISKIRINMPNPKDKNKLNFDHNEKKISNQNLINEIKTIFSKNNKVETKKVNQTFCGFPLNYQDELV